jgi:hypothetical protein
MDHRDLQVWLKEAKRIRLRRESDAINTARYAQVEYDIYQDKMCQLEWSLQLLESDEEVSP